MSIFSTLGQLLRDLAQQGGSVVEALVERVRTAFSGDRETRRRVAFSVAMIALSAKMARADGVVTPAEISAFRRIFLIPPDEIQNVFRLYSIAQQDTAGFEIYASRMRALCEEPPAEGEEGCALLVDVLDGLFHIAGADGVVHERELAFLAEVAERFGLTAVQFERIRARHVDGGEAGAYAVLGVDPSASHDEMRRRYLHLVRENHPDRLAARGVPAEFMAIATERMKAINAAWAMVGRVAVS
ncbi:J domain-containing protein [Aureimonas jatrophae]|uniref:DnaJ like chaperone protein n=1 Tax=Aureimonas jatrophae TaxID=1166073 RepID=A0A1H0CCX3_9HYPH|nr:DnaJ family molecular chaperone [Aureimonas jatrophae]MBB3949177.1 DnaJ like chaperone protein [Aureimonas jatrophae]SDN55663.1 DnaJ like chaperone protein [Aureimonas jatrophae]